ncbi:unnamed protein product [Durusdinium trenchii]|uniref:Tudor domain-containing protein n=1 Tax=Durusdinium trenchii TaxID=1381693 RepID=A0ABP0QAD6_9DINO
MTLGRCRSIWLIAWVGSTMAAIFDAIRSAMGADHARPTGYQPSELAIRSLSNASEKHGLPKAMTADNGLWPGESCVNPSPTNSATKRVQPEILLGGPPEASALSLRSRQPMGSYCSSVPEDRPFGRHGPPVPVPARAASIASSLPERIPSFKTDMDSFVESDALTHEKLADHDGRSHLGMPAMPYPMAPCRDAEAPAGFSLGVTSAPGGPSRGSRPCDKWTEGSIVEVYSASAGRWYAAEVGQLESQGNGKEDIITVIFYLGDEVKQKSVYRNDKALAPLGSHTFSDLPPAFETRPSQSKPGQLVYFDLTTCTKYASLELAWQVHFQRLKQQPAGCETMAAVPTARPSRSSPVPMTIAELEESDAALSAAVEPGKVALPNFGDDLGSQGAYLDYVGAPQAAAAAIARFGKENPMAAGYQVIKASAPQRPMKIRL